MAPGPWPNDAWVNGNSWIKWTSRICLGAASLSFGLLARVSYWSLLGVCPGVLHVPKHFIFSRVIQVRVWILLRLICQEQLRCSPVCKTPTSWVNHISAILVAFLLVFFDSQASVSLLGEVDRAIPVDNLTRCGAVIAEFRTGCSKAGSNCFMTPPNRELTEPFGRSGTLVHTSW
jgi:hypothetical protein